MKLQDLYRIAEQWRSNDNKKYSVEFYSKVIADLLDRKAWAKLRLIKQATRTG